MSKPMPLPVPSGVPSPAAGLSSSMPLPLPTPVSGLTSSAPLPLPMPDTEVAEVAEDTTKESEPREVHPLSRPYTMYCYSDSANQAADYLDSLVPLFTVDTVEAFWDHYQWISTPKSVPLGVILYFFPKDTRPCWEDPGNGGRLQLRLKKGVAHHFWEKLLVGMIGGHFDEELRGMQLSVRDGYDHIGVWTKGSSEGERGIRDLKRRIVEVLGLPKEVADLIGHQRFFPDRR
ncbi:translation Initiation factor eIF- 4e [Kipferlia bialata]|uniref:Translation Initiation factor eIF- 4e n=1 Tax=Kipferlia bialata TaxID=797122 RepID=A0A9K3GKE7_9EUKA|nr:translation Initiation factor eIF- 4e [Kipferlia bialata]|eukprot:g9151.t1